ncbi:MAG: saccharopine dehydrogenase C-terminal domain-containing protein [Pseudomonadota bacterium]
MAQILVLGAGFVAGPLVDYLADIPNNQVIIASQFIDESQKLVKGRDRVSAITVDVNNVPALYKAVAESDIVVSLVPYQFHTQIAEICVEQGKHLVTASYESHGMKALHDKALARGVTLLNEIGLDPGIDHLSAMKMINNFRADGYRIESFISWCGGLPAPSANNNPLGYKFAWAPKGVLLAVCNDALFLRDNEIITKSHEELLQKLADITVSKAMILQGYPNRDSIHYQKIYGLKGIKNLVRGTLRYPGFAKAFQWLKTLNLFDDLPIDSQKRELLSWAEILVKNSGLSLKQVKDDLSQDDNLATTVNWLGLLNEIPIVDPQLSTLDALCDLLLSKLSYQDSETDMVALLHKFVVVSPSGEYECHQSSLIREGTVGGYSAMAQTVGLPAAIATQLLLNGSIRERGCVLPVNPTTYNPILNKLEEKGIVCKEEQIPLKPNEFIPEIYQI